MRKTGMLAVVAVCAALLSGCAAVPSPVQGLFYTEVTFAAPTDQMPDGTLGQKTGKACGEHVLGLVATGDMSLEAAMKAGGITKVTSVDRYSKNLLGIFGEHCTIVHGN